MDQKQQDALKRKFDQAMEQTRRSLEAVETHRKNLIDNELILLYSALDLKNLIDSLVNDQEVLFKYLCDLKAVKEKTAATNDQIKQIEDDLELRGAQIVEMSSKQEDLEEKIKKLSDSFKTIPELRTAVIHLLNKLLDSRNDFKARFTKAEDRIEELLTENMALKKGKTKTKSPKEGTKKKRISTVDSFNEEPAVVKSEDDIRDPDYWPRSLSLQTSIKKAKLTCACKSNCLKHFCICKKAGSYCINCDCINCLNVEPKTRGSGSVEKKETSVDL